MGRGKGAGGGGERIGLCWGEDRVGEGKEIELGGVGRGVLGRGVLGRG